MVLREALGLVAAGVAIGVPAALAATRLASSQISGLLFGLEATDPLTIATALIILTAVTLIAAHLPAKRASLVDPMTPSHTNTLKQKIPKVVDLSHLDST